MLPVFVFCVKIGMYQLKGILNMEDKNLFAENKPFPLLKRTKIVATIGPASKEKETLRKMIENGMNVIRLNFSHNEHSWHQEVIEDVRSLSKEMGLPVGIIADLQGPRIRTSVEGDVEIKTGENIIVSDISVDKNFQFPISNLAYRKAGFQKNFNNQISKIIKLDYPGIIKDIEIGNVILIEDGLKSVKVIEKEKNYLIAEVIDGGTVKNHKGVNIPDAKLSIPPITEKDERDLEFSLRNEVDFVAMSFVSSATDVLNLKSKIVKILGREPARNASHDDAGGNNLPQIVVKIERKEAIKNLDEIIAATDAVMVARGDLGIEMDETKVVIFQKEIIAKSMSGLKPVIVATEMLSSMIENPRPTRAEVSDVTNAVIDHADAVMLSGESANGKYPVEVIKTMAEIIENTEESPYDDMNDFKIDHNFSNEYTNFIKSVRGLLYDSGAKAIAILSRGGFTARVISHFRPDQIILAGTNNEKTYNHSSLVWGVKAFLLKDGKIDEVIENMINKAQEREFVRSGEKIVLIGKNDEKNSRFVDIRKIN